MVSLACSRPRCWRCALAASASWPSSPASDLEMTGTTSLHVLRFLRLLVRSVEGGGDLHEPVKHVEEVALPP